jgi:hypothetical protein
MVHTGHMYTSEARQLHLKSGGPRDAYDYMDQIARLYKTDFFDPSYPSDRASAFASKVPEKLGGYTQAPNFKIVTLWDQGDLAGFVYGCSLPGQTGYWRDVREPLDPEFIEENGSRTLALLVLLIKRSLRGKGWGSKLYQELLNGRNEERVVLLTEPATQPAYSIWQHWGYRKIGTAQPSTDESIRDVFVLSLNRK